MPDLLAAVKSAQELDKAVGLIAKLVGKLKARPDIAALKLGARGSREDAASGRQRGVVLT
jgi:hypothetical protein